MIDVNYTSKLDLLVAQIQGTVTVKKLPRKGPRRSELISGRNAVK